MTEITSGLTGAFVIMAFMAGSIYTAEKQPAGETVYRTGATEKAYEAPAVTEAWKNKVFTKEELAKYNGKNGMPVYVAVNGIVYDLSSAEPWKTGLHKLLHTAGKDLTKAFMKKAPAFHRERMVLDKYPKTGILEQGSGKTKKATKKQVSGT